MPGALLREQQLHSFIVRSVPVTSTHRTTSLLFWEVRRDPACPIPSAWLWCSCVPRGEEKKIKAASEKKSLVRFICLFLPLGLKIPLRIRIWSWMGFVLQTVTPPLQIYIENTALLNFLRFTLCAWDLCLRLWRRWRKYGCTLLKKLLWSELRRQGMAPGRSGRRRGRGGRHFKGHERKQETLTPWGEGETWGRDADCCEDEHKES